MSKPVIELIAENLAAAINEITAANRYNYDLRAVRPKRIDYSDPENPTIDGGAFEDGMVLIEQTTEDPVEEGAQCAQTWDQTFVLQAFVLNSDFDNSPRDTKINKVRADIQKKIMADVRRGGNALNTTLGSSVIYDAGEGFAGIAIEIVVHYRVKYDDPYTKI